MSGARVGTGEGLQVRALAKRFGRSAALEGAELDVRDGELLALLGPSGSGKTTLLRVLAGLEQPDGGTVRFGGRDLLAEPPRRRRIGMVFQNYALFRHMTVAQNIAFGPSVGPRSERPSRAEMAARVEELLALVKLEGYGGRRPGQLSGGQRQRVALARALAIRPRLLLLDEPFGALDAQVRTELRRWLRDVHRETGVTTVLVTHDQEEALETADRIAVMRAGRVLQVGAPAEVYGAPADPFVFAFLGGVAKLPVRLDGVHAWFGDYAMPDASPPGVGEAHVRPEEVEVSAAGQGVPARVLQARRVGARVRLDLDLGEGRTVEVVTAADVALAKGDAVRLRPKRYTLFD